MMAATADFSGRHMTLILITHDMDIARTYSTGLVLSHGDLVYDGLTAEL